MCCDSLDHKEKDTTERLNNSYNYMCVYWQCDPPRVKFPGHRPWLCDSCLCPWHLGHFPILHDPHRGWAANERQGSDLEPIRICSTTILQIIKGMVIITPHLKIL